MDVEEGRPGWQVLVDEMSQEIHDLLCIHSSAKYSDKVHFREAVQLLTGVPLRVRLLPLILPTSPSTSSDLTFTSSDFAFKSSDFLACFTSPFGSTYQDT